MSSFDYTAHGTQNPYGALRKVRDPNFASGWADNYHFEYLYDSYGRPLEERFPDGEKVIVAYDGSGRLANAKFNASSFVTTYAYDGLSRLSTISNSLGQSATYGYYTSAGKRGLPESLTFSSGLVSGWDYDALLRPSEIVHDPASGSNLERYYGYDAASRIVSVDFDASGDFDGWEYEYDDAGQLTREQRLFDDGVDPVTHLDQEYTFDAAGNRLTRTGSGTGHEAFGDVYGETQYNDLNQLRRYAYEGSADIENRYDANGALVGREDLDGATFDWVYTWSPDGYMTRANDTVGRTDIKYVYDWRGRRLEREDETASANGPKRRCYFRGLTPIAERTGTYGFGGYSWSDDVYNTLTGGDLGQVLWRRTGGSTDRALHYDHIGNVVAESNTSGAIVATHEQDAYGRAVLASYSGGWGDNSLHQTAKPWDDATDLHYFNARWYDQQVGQFASVAPTPRSQEHPNRFVEAQPLTLSDRTGEAVDALTCQMCFFMCDIDYAQNLYYAQQHFLYWKVLAVNELNACMVKALDEYDHCVSKARWGDAWICTGRRARQENDCATDYNDQIDRATIQLNQHRRESWLHWKNCRASCARACSTFGVSPTVYNDSTLQDIGRHILERMK